VLGVVGCTLIAAHRKQVGERFECGSWCDPQFVGGELGAVDPEGLETERGGTRNIPKIRGDKANRFFWNL